MLCGRHGNQGNGVQFCISRNTVRKYVRLFLSSGKSIEQLLSLPDVQLDELSGCPASRHREPSPRRIELEALLPGYVSRLSRKGMSVRKLFKEYHAEYPDGYQLSSFKRAVRQYKFHVKVVGHVEHSENCSGSTMPNIRTVSSYPPSSGLSVSTSFTSRSSVMSSTMPQTRCILTLPVTGLKSLMK